MGMPKETVLIVDDEPMIRWTLREALQGWGYDVIEAETGAEALTSLTTPRLGAVLLDINLPDSSGLDLLREMKHRQPQVAVIMITAETFFDTAVSALRGGADDFIGKPIDLNEMHFSLHHALETVKQSGEPIDITMPRVLIVSDSAERIPRLQSIINSNEAEITSVIFPEEWGYVTAGKHDLALIDVGPELLESLLRTLRTNSGHSEIPVLVENGRILGAANLAGVIPKYRAMPCGRDEMIRLARRRITAIREK